MKNRIDKVIFSINFLFGISVCIFYTLKINFTDITPRLNYFFTLIFLLIFTVFLFGTPLWLISYSLKYLSAQNANERKSIGFSFTVNYLPFLSVALSTTYSMMLYFIGLTDSFFSFMIFY